MRLRELTGYKKDPIYNILQNSTSAEELQDNLESNGFKKYVVGLGFYSSVLSRPDLNYVVKIFKDDYGYEEYLKYIVKYQNNPHVPKMRGKVLTVGLRFKVVRLEKLTPLDPNNNFHSQISENIWNYLYLNKADNEPDREILEKQFPQIIPVLDYIMQYSRIDFHEGNIMFRGDVPVITDPLN